MQQTNAEHGTDIKCEWKDQRDWPTWDVRGIGLAVPITTFTFKKGECQSNGCKQECLQKAHEHGKSCCFELTPEIGSPASSDHTNMTCTITVDNRTLYACTPDMAADGKCSETLAWGRCTDTTKSSDAH